MHLLDFLLLSSTLTVLLLITAARISGRLPDRGSGTAARIRGPLDAVKQSPFEGILSQHDGPVRLIPPLIPAS